MSLKQLQTIKNSIEHHLNIMLMISSFTDLNQLMFMRQTDIFPSQYWMPTDSSSLKKIKTAQVAHICRLIQQCNRICKYKQNRSDPQIITITIT